MLLARSCIKWTHLGATLCCTLLKNDFQPKANTSSNYHSDYRVSLIFKKECLHLKTQYPRKWRNWRSCFLGTSNVTLIPGSKWQHLSSGYNGHPSWNIKYALGSIVGWQLREDFCFVTEASTEFYVSSSCVLKSNFKINCFQRICSQLCAGPVCSITSVVLRWTIAEM